jgi:glyoxalase family protein
VKKSVNQDDPNTPHWFWATYDGKSVGPHSCLTFFEWKPARFYARAGAGQTHHIAFRTRSADEQAEWRDHLQSLDIDVSPVLDRSYFTSIYFRSPDGLLLEIATDGPGFLIDEPPHRLGAELRLPAWLEPRRIELQQSLAPLS